ncbi:MAG TPA: ester cyclase [Pyrinomonadaceae bacterium]|nr:ester cyclase [Pyrinomonadaceae bacterium]
MVEEENKNVVVKYVEAFNRADYEALRELFTPDALVYGVLGWGSLDKVVPIWQEIIRAFAIQLNVEAMVAEGDTVAVRYREQGRSVGEWQGQPATGKAYEVVAMEWFIIKNGKIHRRWGARDSATQSRQMGLSV